MPKTLFQKHFESFSFNSFQFFYEPLKENNILEPKHLSLIFGNFLSIYNFHKHILEFMRKCRADWPLGSDKIGIFFRHLSFFECLQNSIIIKFHIQKYRFYNTTSLIDIFLLAASFLFAMPFMNEYLKYVENFHVSMDILESLIKDPKMTRFVSYLSDVKL